jgi:hypothetical protein
MAHQIHNHVDGVPKLRKPELYKCATCTLVNATKQAVTTEQVSTATTTNATQMYNTEAVPIPHPPQIPEPNNDSHSMIPGQVFQMDTGFVRGTKYSHKSEDVDLVTSIGGYNCYLLVVNRATRYKWVFLSRNKSLPINTILNFLNIHGTKEHMLKKICTDEGGELWGSHELQKAIRDAGYIMEPTAPNASFQNGVAERPNRTLADMMRSMLHAVHLGPEYWCWAMLHAVYLKNPLPHQTIATTPYEAYTGQRPN